MSRSLSDLDWPVTTERLTIRPAEQRDALPTYAFRTLEEVAYYMGMRPQDPDEWEAGFAERIPTTLIVERDGELVGDLYLSVQDPWAQREVKEQAAGTMAEIGYVLDPAHTGHGYATEAARALLEIAFEGIGVRRVVAQCFAENEASWRLMERIGMRREQHTKQDSLHRDGTWRDGMMYALLADEWRAAR